MTICCVSPVKVLGCVSCIGTFTFTSSATTYTCPATGTASISMSSSATTRSAPSSWVPDQFVATCFVMPSPPTMFVGGLFWVRLVCLHWNCESQSGIHLLFSPLDHPFVMLFWMSNIEDFANICPRKNPNVSSFSLIRNWCDFSCSSACKIFSLRLHSHSTCA